MPEMRFHPLIFLSLAACMLFLPESCEQRKAYETYKVYYVPFDIHFYGALEADRIEKESYFIFETTSPVIDKLYSVVSSGAAAAQKADDVMDLRIKLLRPRDGKAVYIDTKNDVISDGQTYAVAKWLVDAVIAGVVSKARDSECMGEDFICNSLTGG